MTNEIKTWAKANSGLATFLIGEAMAIATILASLVAYAVRMDTRIETLEVRGSPHIEKIDSRVTTIETKVNSHEQSIDRIVNVMTRELNKGDRK